MTGSEFSITIYDGSVCVDALDEAVALYREVYVEPPYLESEDDFTSFAASLPSRVKQESFRLIVARSGGAPIGFALGHRLQTLSTWWDGAMSPLPAEVTQEYLGRTFAIIELATRRLNRRNGVAERMHLHLTAGLKEERVTLLVRPDAKPAQTAYSSWGYKAVGKIRPYLQSPTYDALVRKL